MRRLKSVIGAVRSRDLQSGVTLVYAIRQFKLKGRGLVATAQIVEGTSIVTCPVIVYDDADAGRISKTRLGDYNFRFGERQNRACIILGVISLCNHAEEPNAQMVCDEEALTATLVATRPIAAGEEICIRYRRPLWFTPAA
jgi:SET domain-containing protein